MPRIVVQAGRAQGLSSGVHVGFSAGSSVLQRKFKLAAFNGGVERNLPSMTGIPRCHACQGMNMKNRSRIATSLFVFALSPLAIASAPVVNQGITEAEVLAGQKAWCQALVDISTTHQRNGQAAAKALAEKVIDAAYGYQMGPVLFKPTLTVAPQTFRTTRDGALAYFVGGNAAFPNDTGFALKGWSGCEIANAAVFIAGDKATTMGNVNLTGPDGKITSVDKTWGFVKDDKGALRIVVHHSSLPFSGS
jgi:hypothetical protein